MKMHLAETSLSAALPRAETCASSVALSAHVL